MAPVFDDDDDDEEDEDEDAEATAIVDVDVTCSPFDRVTTIVVAIADVWCWVLCPLLCPELVLLLV